MLPILAGGRPLALNAKPPDRPSRIVSIKIAACADLGIRPAWKRDVKRLIATSSETFKDMAGIEFRISGWEQWSPDKHQDSLQGLLDDLKMRVPPGEADLVLGLAAPFSPDDPPAGIADYFQGTMLLELVDPWALAPVLLHELGHVFGAVDLEEEGSAMDPRNPAFKFDPFSVRIIALNRERSFHSASFPFPPRLLTEVISEYRARADLKRREPELHLFLAYLYIDAGDYALAAEECEDVLKSSPDSVDAAVLLGNLRLAQGNVDQAIAEYKKILDVRRDLPAVHYNLGVAWSRKEMTDEAVSEFREAVRLNPGYAEAHANLGRLYLKKGEPDPAVEYARRALSIVPDFPEGLCILSVALILKEESALVEEAVELSRKAVALRPQLPEAHVILGIACGNMGRDEEAEAEFRKTLELKPESLEAHLSLAMLFKKTGRTDQAAFHLARIAQIDPGFLSRHQIQPEINVVKLRSWALVEGLH